VSTSRFIRNVREIADLAIARNRALRDGLAANFARSIRSYIIQSDAAATDDDEERDEELIESGCYLP
jgi:chromosome condensin MukBEF MukE localization factor